MKARQLLLASALLLCAMAVRADDDSQSELRLNPEIEAETAAATQTDYSLYPFLKLSKNHIDMNGADWSSLRRKLADMDSTGRTVSVVYLGDSHIQADFGGAVLRQRLGSRYGNAGRGIIIPFRQAGTNQPFDYTLRIGPEVLYSKILKLPWATEMPFTGIGIQPVTEAYTLDIRADQPFNTLRLHYRGAKPEITSVATADGGRNIEFSYADSVITLAETVGAVKLRLRSGNRTVLGGIGLGNGRKGTFLHSVGNNGATYSSYGNIDHFGAGLAGLDPDLVVIALGTNEAFGRIDEETLENDIDNLVGNIRRHNPDAEILLVSPTECYRKVYRRVKGRRRRRSSTVVNTKVARVRDVIRRYAADNGIPFYDTYEVVGGAGSAQRMKLKKVLGKDGVHFTATGYRLLGSLLSDAILEKTEVKEVESER